MFLVKKRDNFWTVCSLTKPIGDKTHLKKKKFILNRWTKRWHLSFFLSQYKVTFFVVVMVDLLSFLFGIDQPRRFKRERWT
jgi:hypothetical protein